ncbi:hypothetical protein NSK_001822 [Nannochloropsis salina CCMP1776]|uniref:Uncharacterized protein n=1 Tax=Nannochloropsis salina CCMP1776 TaxID=1027361 RepID=A0A4D9D6T6_9STRA|nr:hypothetical protein NSK_001822 [Nannochloropsis salina CCMP1776]|eukprot:TFJ86734.1 hypothetical protein NSK_001822 [Nannochloropsis salina CCMP1776]
MASSKASTSDVTVSSVEGMQQLLFVQMGFGCDQHGQDATKAAVKACRNAIEWNSLPSINQIVPGGYEAMKVRVQIAVPVDATNIDTEAIKKAFPYGQLLPVEIQSGGMRASSGIALPAMGDRNDDWIVAIAAVSVGW